MATTLDPFRTGKAYTIAQAARFAGTTSPTIRRWLMGYKNRDRQMQPVFSDKLDEDGSTPRLSFLDLCEIVVAVRFRKFHGDLEKVRQARKRALSQWPELQYPFASLNLKIMGGEMLHVFDEEYGGKPLVISVGSPGEEQYTLPHMVEEALDLFHFDAEDRMAVRWFPAGRNSAVVVDPRFAGGRPTIQGRGVTVNGIYRRFKIGLEKQVAIARDLDITTDDVEEALRYAGVA